MKALDEIHGNDAFDDYDPGISDDTSSIIKLMSHINTVTSTDTKVFIKFLTKNLNNIANNLKFYSFLFAKNVENVF